MTERLAVVPPRRGTAAPSATEAAASRPAGSPPPPSTASRVPERRPPSAAAREPDRSRATPAATTERSFRLPEVVLGVLLVAGCALAAVLWQAHVSRTTTIVVAARPIARGAVIGAADLGGAQLSGNTSALIAGSQAQVLIGQIAAVDISVDTPLTPTLVRDEQPLAAGEALTSVALEAGNAPPDLAPSDEVRIVVTTASSGGAAPTVRLLEPVAVVWSVEAGADGVSTIVTIRGPLSVATDVAGVAAVSIVRVGG